MLISPYFIFITCFIAAVIYAVFAVRKNIRQKAAAEVFIALLIVLFSLFFFNLSLCISNEKVRIVCHELKFVTLSFLGPASLAVYLKFTDCKAISRKQWMVLLIIPAVTVVFVLTNNYHHFFRRELFIFTDGGVSYVGVKSSWWYWVHLAYSYSLFVIGIIILAVRFYNKPRIYRGHIGIMIFTGIAVIAISILTAFGFIPDNGDLSLVCCSFTCILQYFTIVKHSHKHIIQEARNLVIGDVSSPVLIFDHNNLLVDANIAANKLIQLILPDTVTLQGRNPIYFEQLKSGLNRIATNDAELDGMEIFLSQKKMTFSVSGRLLYDERSRYTGRAVLFNDITALKMAVNELEYITNHDFLTGLINRHTLNEVLRNIHEPDLPTALISVNILGMRLFNSIFGSEYGDNVIISTAKVIELAALEQADGIKSDKNFVARLNGDEFGIVLKNTSVEEAEAFIEKVRHILRNNEDKHDIGITAGFAVVTEKSCDAAALLTSTADSLRKKSTQYMRSISPVFLESIRSSLRTLIDKTGQRTEKITELCIKIAEKLKISTEEKERLRLLSVMADIGLLSAAPSLINNLGNLTNEQWDEMKLHTIRGYNIALSALELSNIADEIVSHHERFDGYGYPNGLKGDEIPLLARIYTAVEFYTDLLLDGKNDFRLITSLSGTRLDPGVVDAIMGIEGYELRKKGFIDDSYFDWRLM